MAPNSWIRRGSPVLRRAPRDIPMVSGRNGAVVAVSSVAAAAGLRMLMSGGNAIDAATTAAAMATVSDCSMSSIGGHGIMIMYWAKTGEVKVLDWGGFLPHAFSLDQWGVPPAMPPETSLLSMVFPGTLAGWAEALSRHGTITLRQALEPAIEGAEHGVPVLPDQSLRIAGEAEVLRAHFPEAAGIYMPEGRVPRAGEILRYRDLAKTYRRIAAEGPDCFYKGELGEKVVQYCNQNGSRFTREEFAAFQPIWRESLRTTYRDRWEIIVPKNQNSSPVMLELFNIWERFDLPAMGLLSPAALHLLIESTKIGLADRKLYGDPDFSTIPYELLCTKAYAARMADRIDMRRASPQTVSDIRAGSTTAIAAVDRDHNVVLITQTVGVFLPWHVVPGTGIFLNHEGRYFDLLPAEGPNSPASGKRVENSMGGAIVLQDGKVWAGAATPGGIQIPLAQAELLMRAIDHKLGIQEAMEVPLCRYVGNGKVQLESEAIPWGTLQELWEMGHDILPRKECVRNRVCQTGLLIDADSGVMEAGAHYMNSIAVAY